MREFVALLTALTAVMLNLAHACSLCLRLLSTCSSIVTSSLASCSTP